MNIIGVLSIGCNLIMFNYNCNFCTLYSFTFYRSCCMQLSSQFIYITFNRPIKFIHLLFNIHSITSNTCMAAFLAFRLLYLSITIYYFYRYFVFYVNLLFVTIIYTCEPLHAGVSMIL